MKARVKATGEIVTLYGTIAIDSCVWVTTDFRQYWESELEFIDNDERGSDDSLSVAFGECRDAIKRQAEATKRMLEDVEKYSKALRKFNVLAKSLPRQDRKSYVSPYAKFNKIRRKRK